MRAALLALSTIVAAAPAAELGRGPFEYSADLQTADLRKDTMELSGNVRLTQQETYIEAGQAQAQSFRSDNSQWMFEHSVHVRTLEADLKADTAHASFRKGQITTARVEGSPAEFAQRGGLPDREVRGHAAAIDYDLNRGIVTLTGDVWFGYGKDEFRGPRVVYDIREQRVTVNPDRESPERVRGIIQPRPKSENAPQRGSEVPKLSPENGA